MGELVPFDHDQVVDLAPPYQREAISLYLAQAKGWLATAVEQATPEQVANAKAEVATLSEATKQLGLSRDIRQDAQEMVRRAEYVLGKAIRKGQAEGTVRNRGYAGPQRAHIRNGKQIRGSTRGHVGLPEITSPTTLVSGASELTDVYKLADGVEPEQFEAGLAEAKEEGDLTRANVTRKVFARVNRAPMGRTKRSAIIAELAGQGHSSPQIADHVGLSTETVREIARDYSIEINADKVVGKRRQINFTAAVESAVTELDNWSSSLSIIDFTEVDLTEADEWVASLTASSKELRRFIERIREASHV